MGKIADSQDLRISEYFTLQRVDKRADQTRNQKVGLDKAKLMELKEQQNWTQKASQRDERPLYCIREMGLAKFSEMGLWFEAGDNQGIP